MTKKFVEEKKSQQRKTKMKEENSLLFVKKSLLVRMQPKHVCYLPGVKVRTHVRYNAHFPEDSQGHEWPTFMKTETSENLPRPDFLRKKPFGRNYVSVRGKKQSLLSIEFTGNLWDVCDEQKKCGIAVFMILTHLNKQS